MEYVLCVIMVYSSGDRGLKHEATPIYGVFMKQSVNSDTYLVDFTKGFDIAKTQKNINVEVQWVHHNQCTYLAKGVVPK